MPTVSRVRPEQTALQRPGDDARGAGRVGVTVHHHLGRADAAGVRRRPHGPHVAGATGRCPASRCLLTRPASPRLGPCQQGVEQPEFVGAGHHDPGPGGVLKDRAYTWHGRPRRLRGSRSMRASTRSSRMLSIRASAARPASTVVRAQGRSPLGEVDQAATSKSKAAVAIRAILLGARDQHLVHDLGPSRPHPPVDQDLIRERADRRPPSAASAPGLDPCRRRPAAPVPDLARRSPSGADTPPRHPALLAGEVEALAGVPGTRCRPVKSS